eukprot:1145420-Pleurochrysis_carterae.AAC.1
MSLPPSLCYAEQRARRIGSLMIALSYMPPWLTLVETKRVKPARPRKRTKELHAPYTKTSLPAKSLPSSLCFAKQRVCACLPKSHVQHGVAVLLAPPSPQSFQSVVQVPCPEQRCVTCGLAACASPPMALMSVGAKLHCCSSISSHEGKSEWSSSLPSHIRRISQ